MLNLKSANLKLRFKLRESYNLVRVRIGTQDRIGKFKSLQAGIRNYK